MSKKLRDLWLAAILLVSLNIMLAVHADRFHRDWLTVEGLTSFPEAIGALVWAVFQAAMALTGRTGQNPPLTKNEPVLSTLLRIVYWSLMSTGGCYMLLDVLHASNQGGASVAVSRLVLIGLSGCAGGFSIAVRARLGANY